MGVLLMFASSPSQASTLSNAAAESAQHKLRSLDGFKPPLASLGSLGKPAEPERPAPADLALYGVTEELLDFVRSLTYSTFRDFPADTLPPPPQVLLTHPEVPDTTFQLMLRSQLSCGHGCPMSRLEPAPANRRVMWTT